MFIGNRSRGLTCKQSFDEFDDGLLRADVRRHDLRLRNFQGIQELSPDLCTQYRAVKLAIVLFRPFIRLEIISDHGYPIDQPHRKQS
jgi:hypothetical protein